MQLIILVFILMTLTLFVGCVPTAVLAKDARATGYNFKVKRSPSVLLKSENENQKSDKNPSTVDFEIPKDTILDLGLKNEEFGKLSDYQNNDDKSPHKRGINPELLYDDSYLNEKNNYPTFKDGRNYDNQFGVWPDEIESSNSDLGNYLSRGQYHTKMNENLQNVLNSEQGIYHREPIIIPLHYYSSDREKRSNRMDNEYDVRLKDTTTKLTPDLLALVALIEADDRDEKAKPSLYYYPDEREQNLNTWTLPTDNESNEYYNGNVYNSNFENVPQYKVFAEPTYAFNHDKHPTPKRFMVSKKKRSLGHIGDMPIPNHSYSSLKYLKEPKQLKVYY